MALSARQWIDQFSAALGVTSPTDEEVAAILDVAGAAAHASERTAAPVSTWLSAQAGVSASVALDTARRLAAEVEGSGPPERPS
jgi:hypothetical protein